MNVCFLLFVVFLFQRFCLRAAVRRSRPLLRSRRTVRAAKSFDGSLLEKRCEDAMSRLRSKTLRSIERHVERRRMLQRVA